MVGHLVDSKVELTVDVKDVVMAGSRVALWGP